MSKASAPKRVLIGVGGGIAAYKVCSLVRMFREAGHRVDVIPTPAALEFVGTATWAALSGNPVHTSVWEDVHAVPHVNLGQQADLVLVAPATADLMSRAAAGAADDLLTSTLLMAHGPVVFLPAMHSEMWEHAATAANVALLRERGAIVLDPSRGRLTGKDSGPGRLPEPRAIYTVAEALLTTRNRADLAGRRVVVAVGGTREPLDPVRYLGNLSSGKMGLAVAAAAVARGAQVSVVAANVDAPPIPGATTHSVGTAAEMRDMVNEVSVAADAVVMAAAVADYRPARQESHKIKKASGDENRTLDLIENDDILAGLVQRRTDRQTIVGFAAETGDSDGTVLEHGRRKLVAKGCDLLVVNDVSHGETFGSDTNEVEILSFSGQEIRVPRASKATIANRVWDAVLGHEETQ